MKIKSILITLGICVAVVAFIFSFVVSVSNRAVNMEEMIYESEAAIQVQEKRRVDLIYNLVDTAEAYAGYESQTLKDIVDARNQSDSAQITFQAIAEQYPELKANEQYKQLMTELSLTENLIAEHRNNYNKQVKTYKQYVRKFPNKQILNMMGYEVIDTEYTEYDAPQDAPQNLFGE